MKQVFKCDYCSFMGTEDEVREHESICTNNYDAKSCWTCQHRGYKTGLKGFTCDKGLEVPDGKIYTRCGKYDRKEKKSDNGMDEILNMMFGVR